MYRSHSTSLDDTVAALRKQLPTASPVVFLPSVRVHDATEVVRGRVLALGLLSSRLCVDWFGDFTSEDNPSIYAFAGTLTERHQAALVPLLENAARAGGALVIAAQGYDHQMASLLLVNHLKATVRATALMPPPGEGLGALESLATLVRGTMGHAGDALVFGQGGMVRRVIASIEETVLIGELGADTQTIGIVYVGGAELPHARARAREARVKAA